MPTFNPASDQAEYELPEPGLYIATCLNIEDAPDKGFGPGVKWIFSLANPASGEILQNADGTDAELWQWTSVKMSPKARARPIVEALLGRPLNVDGREQPDVRALIGRSMQTLVIHEKRDDGSDTARVTSCRPHVSPAPPNAAPALAQQQPPAAPAPDVEALRMRVRKAVRSAEILGTPQHLNWISLPIDHADERTLAELLEQINADILAGSA